jgi:hypothetical protein
MYKVHLIAEFSIVEAKALKIFCKKIRISMLEELIGNEEAHEVFNIASKFRFELQNIIPPVDVIRDFKLLSEDDDDFDWNTISLDIYISSSEAAAFSKYLRKAELKHYENIFDKKITAENMNRAAWTLKAALDFAGRNIDQPLEY